MSVVCICMSACLSLRETTENMTFVKLQHILVFLNILYILCIIMLSGDVLHLSFDSDIHILITYQNSTKISFLFISMGSSFWFGIIWYYVILWTQF